jgi:hypothetical protein
MTLERESGHFLEYLGLNLDLFYANPYLHRLSSIRACRHSTASVNPEGLVRFYLLELAFGIGTTLIHGECTFLILNVLDGL